MDILAGVTIGENALVCKNGIFHERKYTLRIRILVMKENRSQGYRI